MPETLNFPPTPTLLGADKVNVVDIPTSRKSSIAALRELAIKNGMTTIKQDGFLKVIEEMTTIEEIERVMGE